MKEGKKITITNCHKLEKIVISQENYDDLVIANCDNLKSVEINSNQHESGKPIENTSKEEFVIKDTILVDYIGSGNKDVVIIPEGVTSIEVGNDVFNKNGLTIGRLVFPKSFKSNYYYGSMMCRCESSKIAELDFSKTTFTEFSKIFGCNLTTIYLPKTLKTLKEMCFNQSNSLEAVIFHPECKLERIEDSVFFGCKSVKINLPKTVKYIGNYAFCGTNLTNIDLPDVEIIKYNAFANCENLKTVNFPKLKVLEDCAFEGCKKLINVSFPSLESIGKRVFYDTPNFKLTPNFPNLQKIELEAFSGCVVDKARVGIGLELLHNTRSVIEKYGGDLDKVLRDELNKLTIKHKVTLDLELELPDYTLKNVLINEFAVKKSSWRSISSSIDYVTNENKIKFLDWMIKEYK